MKHKKAIQFIAACFLLLSLFGCRAAEPAAPDYADSSNWAYWQIGQEKNVDLFLLCPTVFSGNAGQYNFSLSDTETRQNFLGALNMERGIYETTCRMYAPYYRQAGLNVYTMEETEAAPYFAIAYQDVKKAFSYYLEHENKGRPIVLAGFSQGADMALRLLKDFFSNPEYQNRLVAAYIIGWRVTGEDLQKYPFLKMAQGETDTGVIVSFNSEAPEVGSSIIVPDSSLGINPLNWKTDDTPADASLNQGACFTSYSGEIQQEIPHLTGAYLDPTRGTLKIPDITPEQYPPGLSIFEPGVYHLYDYQFFYRNLQENVGVRVSQFIQDS